RPLASPDSARCGPQPFVRGAVAIVVLTIAYLGLRTSAADTDIPGPVDAGLRAEFALADIGSAEAGGSVLTVAAGLRVVRSPVAIVILAVAGARRAWINARIGVVAILVAQ